MIVTTRIHPPSENCNLSRVFLGGDIKYKRFELPFIREIRSACVRWTELNNLRQPYSQIVEGFFDFSSRWIRMWPGVEKLLAFAITMSGESLSALFASE